MDNVRFGLIGLGNMGSSHVDILKGVKGATLTAICDTDAQVLARIAPQCGAAKTFDNHVALLESGLVDAIIIATPHYDHPPIGIAALQRGIHVLTEKPIAVTGKGARTLADEAAKHPKLKFGIMFQQRSSAMFQKLREVIAEGELGENIADHVDGDGLVSDARILRIWRVARDLGRRGGGVLINQCPHNLDLIWWITGIYPNRVTAVASIGKTHPIEVEDEVSAIFEYPNGAIGHFVTTTGEAPGTNRLEIAGERGKIVADQGKLKFYRTRKNVQEVNRTDPRPFSSIEVWEAEIPFARAAEGHQVMVQNFVNAILRDEALIAPGADGVKGLELGNAILMAGLTRQPVALPMDGEKYEKFLADLTTKYGGKKALKTVAAVSVDLASSFAKM